MKGRIKTHLCVMVVDAVVLVVGCWLVVVGAAFYSSNQVSAESRLCVGGL